MHVSGLPNALVPGTAARPPGRRVQPVDAIVRYTPVRSHSESAASADVTLEGEFLRNARPHHSSSFAARQALSGTLVNAARAVSAYANVSNATSVNDEQKRQRLDLRV